MNIFTRIIFIGLLSVIQSAYAAMDDKTLKEYLSRNFTSGESMAWEERSGFKTSHDIPDEQLHRVLMEIYKEAAEIRSSLTPKTRQWYDNRSTIEGVLGWLPISGSIQVKDFLMDYASVKENDSLNRRVAVLSFLRIADAEEAKTVLFRFLVEGDRMDHMARLSLYSHARTAYDSASPDKKAAILVALIAAANKEEGKIEFMKVDKILAERSAAYRYSRERLAMLERHSLEPPTTNLYTDRDLKAALEECRNYKSHTNITTNRVLLKSRDFKMLQSELLNTNLTVAVHEGADKGAQSPNVAKRGIGAIIITGAAALLLLGFLAWRLARK